MRFYVPPNMPQHYDNFLKTVGQPIKYCRDVLSDNPVWIDENIEVSSINYKSKQYGSDNAVKIGMSLSSDIQKGDYILYGNKIHMVTWQVNEDQLNAHTAIMELANIEVDFLRYSEEVIDPETGEKLSNAGYNSLFGKIRCMQTVGGSYEVRMREGQGGLVSNNRLVVYLQANPKTFVLRENDVFVWHGTTHIIRDITYDQLTYEGDCGLLVVRVEKSNLEVNVNA